MPEQTINKLSDLPWLVDVVEDATMTREAEAYFRQLAEDAIRDLSALPEGSQPLWFRTYKN